ncbi:hypothetical protein EVG20_g151 [Dentipellis fragilis]|uniref:Probable RNA polymerase II nuclear localization protein SLC7A6OS n=1 Tax=Dentipellis fragilis TaxID=205917 RepID=A0A4Y9ZG57_9AGAM|nr:hypothetical protein EVG20_g151 [Dentipellis fragilis]
MTSEKTSLPPRQPYTILRIKRKRTDEPLDALVVQSRIRRKKSRGGMNVFQFAETLEQDAWDDERATKELQDRISTLAREQSSQVGAEPAREPLAAPPRADSGRQYTVINALGDLKPNPYATAPPAVLSAKDLEKQKADFQMYDAILASENATPMDPEIEKFLPMLQDYLKVGETAPPASAASAPLPSPGVPPASNVEGPDYVWDVFFHRPGALNYTSVSNIGTLTGLPASFADPFSSDSESEPEDDADEDSNAEEYYKNDYPDEEDSDGSDEFHERSDHDDMRNDYDMGSDE